MLSLIRVNLRSRCYRWLELTYDQDIIVAETANTVKLSSANLAITLLLLLTTTSEAMVRTKDTQIIGGTRVVARKTKSPKKKIVAPVPVTNKRRFRPGNLT